MTDPIEITTPTGLITVTVQPWQEHQRAQAIRELREFVGSLQLAFPEIAPQPIGYLAAHRANAGLPWIPISMDGLGTWGEVVDVIHEMTNEFPGEWQILPVNPPVDRPPTAPTGGTFTVGSGGKTSPPLPHDATIFDIRAAYAALAHDDCRP